MKIGGKKMLLLALIIGTSFGAGVYASDGIERVDAFLRPDFKVLVDGAQANLTRPPLVYDDKSYLPLKELADMMNAEVKWEEMTKTIYVNSRIPGQAAGEPVPDEITAELKLEGPAVYEVQYLGGQYTLLSVYSGYLPYFRANDLLAMGVDIRGLKKAKEKYTGMLFVRQDEVESLWKQLPYMTYTLNPAIAGTTDPALKAKLKEMATQTIPLLGSAGLSQYSRDAHIFAIDSVPGKTDWFLMLSSEGKEETQVYAVNVKQEENGAWSYKTIQSMSLSYVPQFLKDLK